MTNLDFKRKSTKEKLSDVFKICKELIPQNDHGFLSPQLQKKKSNNSCLKKMDVYQPEISASIHEFNKIENPLTKSNESCLTLFRNPIHTPNISNVTSVKKEITSPGLFCGRVQIKTLKKKSQSP